MKMISDSSRCVSSMARDFHIVFTQREFPYAKTTEQFGELPCRDEVIIPIGKKICIVLFRAL
jgi:hypothetical protein